MEDDPLAALRSRTDVVVTNFGSVWVTPQTAAMMDRTFPGWRDPKAIKGRKRAQRLAREHAAYGDRMLTQAACAISALAWAAEQELVQI